MILWDARIDFIKRGMPGPTWFDYVKREQLDVRALADIGVTVVVCKCRPAGRGRFEFDDDTGFDAAVIEVMDAAEENVEDFCAWRLEAPERFATLLGRSGVLGAGMLINPASYFAGQSLRAWQTPLQWLKARGQGFVILNDRTARRCFKTARSRKHAIETDDAEHGYRIASAGGLRQQSIVYWQD